MITGIRNGKFTFILLLVISAITLFFFLFAHPTVIISGDDWGNLIVRRGLYPQWGITNPIKVMPEIGYPFFSRLSIKLIMPFGFGFLESFSIITAIFITILMAVLFNQLYKLFAIDFESGFYRAYLLVAIEYSLIFLLFRKSGNHESLYMLWEVNITCFYHYIAPALINSALAIYIIRKWDSLSIDHFKRNGIIFSLSLILFSYISIYSSLFANVILAVVCGVCCLVIFIDSRLSLLSTLRKCPLQILTLLMWVVSLIFEANGGRANSVANAKLDIDGSIKVFGDLISQINPVFIYSGIFLIIYGLFISVKTLLSRAQKRNAIIFIITFISALIVTVALLILCSKAGSYYAARPVAMWGVFLFSSACAMMALDYVSNKYKKHANIILSLIVMLMIYKNTSSDSTLKESINLNLSYEKAINISQGIIDQVVEADKNNKGRMILIVPKADSVNNWPFPIYGGTFINDSLKKYKFISNNMYIEVKPDPEVNEKMGIPFK
ncbi:hypothetical protein Y71_17045 [Kosakonia radicincitans DSM 16656]|uniref:hypothetical protein n=1 Tax=Kosakonia radicincitans TaxID=283686 RepID=UPI0009BD065B|nr:hypothetical protein [Kosakonia radicincitans]ARD61548.1 hypothetical protein Y71_17045 [Kosakonia radicincitans DSM 16656]